MTLNDKLAQINKWLGEGDGKQLWDIITASRGPDFPSERADGRQEDPDAYNKRVARKMKTVAVIRGRVFTNARGARQARLDYVTLPGDKGAWDHFDKHVERAARALGLRVEYE